MQIALIGWQSSGKSTLFTALTGNQPSIGEEAFQGTAIVPDPILDAHHELYPPAKKVNARVDYLDVVGLAASQKQSGLKRSLVNHIQGANVLAVVIGVFQHGDVDTESIAEDIKLQLEDLETELLLSDMQIVENRIERIEHSKKRAQKVDPLDEKVMHKVQEALENETPLRLVDFAEDELKAMRSYAFLTLKPLLIIVNHSEEQDGKAIAASLEDVSSGAHRQVEVLNASIEAEIAQLEQEDRELFLEEMGIETPASDRVIRAGFNLLGLIRFFTVGDDEVRAWPIPKGMIAMDAAGTIHSDLSRGFIRAEVVHSDDLLRLKTLSACRDQGLLRLEGKQYVVTDGDVMHIRFAV